LMQGTPIEKIMLRGGWHSESSVIRYLQSWDLMCNPPILNSSHL
jgi:hypothetical protein